jgi:hypothetical protein
MVSWQRDGPTAVAATAMRGESSEGRRRAWAIGVAEVQTESGDHEQASATPPWLFRYAADLQGTLSKATKQRNGILDPLGQRAGELEAQAGELVVPDVV